MMRTGTIITTKRHSLKIGMAVQCVADSEVRNREGDLNDFSEAVSGLQSVVQWFSGKMSVTNA